MSSTSTKTTAAIGAAFAVALAARRSSPFSYPSPSR